MSVEVLERAEQMLSVEHDNAEADAIQGQAPSQHLLDTDADYRRRYVFTLLARYRALMPEKSAESELISDVF